MDLGQSRQRVHFEQSLAGAEVGINYALSHLQDAFDGAYSDYPIPTPKTAIHPRGARQRHALPPRSRHRTSPGG